MSYDKLPPGLKEETTFCLYKLEPGKDGKKKKVPYQTSGARADPGNKAHLTDFATATNIESIGGYAGLGLSVTEDMAAVDIDCCVVDGKLNAFAQEIVDKLGTYAELSPSGTGVHIWGRAPNLLYDTTKYYMKNTGIGLEVYVGKHTTRFLTLTGEAINNLDVNDCSEALQEVLDTYMVRLTAQAPPVEAPGSFLSDESVIAKMFSAKNAENTKALWEGQIPEGKSHSEADMSLCMILAFWCGGDAEQIDRIFRQSALMRDKWDERHGADTYGNLTINNAIRQCREFYKPMGISLAEADFNDIATVLLDLNPESNRRYRNGDLGNGRLFADVFKDIARYVPERRMWYIYDSIRWVPDVGSLKAMELCKDLADAMTLYATAIADEGVRTAFLETCKKWQQRRFRETFLKEAQSVYPIYMKCFDTDIYLFNCKNGTLDLKSGIFREHRPEDLITKVSMVEYVPDAMNERFCKFVEEITSGDQEKAIFLQKALGYGISGDTRYECMFFLYGETTRNGKGTLMESVLSVMGDYGRAVRPETIALKSNNNSSNPTEDIARLAGIRFANISEPSRGLFLNAAQVKNMTGNDTLNARFLHENSFDFKPQFKLYVNTNYLPVINDMTIFSSNRVHIIPFDRHFEEWEQGRSLSLHFFLRETVWPLHTQKQEIKQGIKHPIVKKMEEYIMNNFITTDIGSMEYDKDFWNYMRGQKHVEDRLAAGKNRNNGTYRLPLTSNKAFLKALSEKSIFRKLGKVVKANESDGKIFVSDAEEMAQWVAPNGVENIYEMVDEFRKIPTVCNKVAITIRTDLDFLKDNGFSMEQHTLPILTKSFARAEENAFINGTGVNMPKGILHETDGAEVGVTAEDTSDITFDEVIKLFTSVKPEYRANGVWLMSDETALKLRMLKDDKGNYIWNHNNDTILGKPVQISEFMPVCKSGAKTIAFGDFSYYWVLECMPMTIRPLVEKYALHNQIGHLAFEYLDGVLIRPEAIKVIQMA